MTTLAYKDGVLAFDGLICIGDEIIARNMVKAIATKKFLAGAAGGAAYVQAFLEWARAGRKQGAVPHDHNGKTGEIAGIIVDDRGHITIYEDGMLPLYLGPQRIHAIGSGSAYALGAMAAGASALEAVNIAARYAVNTGGVIRSVHLPQLLNRETVAAFAKKPGDK